MIRIEICFKTNIIDKWNKFDFEETRNDNWVQKGIFILLLMKKENMHEGFFQTEVNSQSVNKLSYYLKKNLGYQFDLFWNIFEQLLIKCHKWKPIH